MTIAEGYISGRPVALLRFRFSDRQLGITSAERDISHDGMTYSATPLSYPSIKADGTVEKSGIKIVIPRDCETARTVLRDVPEVVEVELIVGELVPGIGISEPKVLFLGIVATSTANASGELELALDPLTSSLRRQGLTRNWSHTCPHVLYGPACKAVKADHTLVGTVRSVLQKGEQPDGSWSHIAKVEIRPTLGAVTTESARLYVGGTATWHPDNSDRIGQVVNAERFLISLTEPGLRISLNTTPSDLSVGDRITVAKGCGRTMESCGDVFGNIQNFGGFPWIPFEYPIHKSFIG